MANRKNQAEAGVQAPDLAGAAERAGLAILDLQSRIGARLPLRPAHAEGDELESQLRGYFDRAAPASPAAAPAPPTALDALREKVIEGVIERILREWKQPGSSDDSPLQREVMNRLIARVLEQMRADGD